MKKMKIALIGLGYWGKIILKNLENLGKDDFVLCEITNSDIKDLQGYEIVNDYKKIDCDSVLITTPISTHFEISKYFLEKNVNVFCEKPLTTSSVQAEQLYNMAIKNNLTLFTDWIFIYNSHIETIKRDYEGGKLGKIRSISMNRLNLGPARTDVNARWDLAAHDVSIIQYIFSKIPINIKWIDYKRSNSSKQEDSALGLLQFEDFTANINVSWQYRKKVRECVFEFENYFVLWDDFKRFLQYEDSSQIAFPIFSGNLTYPCTSYQEPLKKSLNAFFSFSKEDMIKQKKLTIETIKILEV